MEPTKTPPRPKRTDDAIIKAVARRLAPKILKWLDDDTLADVDKIVADLEKEIKYEDDGYQIARGLDGNYNPDAQLVEILNECYDHRRTAYEAACVEWIKANNIQPVPVGSRVRWPRKEAAGIGVVFADYKEGFARVKFPAMGEVYYIVEWEDLKIEEAK